MSIVVDSSAILAFLQQEPGSAVVEEHFARGTVIGAANWSEVAQKTRVTGSWSLAKGILGTYEVLVEPVTEADGEWAAARWTPGEGLSLADRLCLALAARLDLPVLTADRSWGSGHPVVQLR
ncbi:MAG: PIN domain-containing protein [Microthrixaceae bacterium]